MKRLKNNKSVGNDGIPSEVYKFASERLLTIMSIFLSGCMLAGKLPSTLMHVVSIPLLKCKSKDPADINNYRPIAIAMQLSPRYLIRSCCRDSPGTCELQTVNLVSSMAHGTEMAIFALKRRAYFYCNQDTPVYITCAFLMHKMNFIELIIGTIVVP